MKSRKILILILLIVSILGIPPYFVGSLARKTIQQQAERISQLPGYTFEIKNYDQGWFTSHMVVSYGFDDHTLNILDKSAKEKADYNKEVYDLLREGLVFDISVAHGPVTFQNGLNIALLTLSGSLNDLTGASFQNLKKNTDINSFLTLFSAISFDGTTNVTAHSPAFTIKGLRSTKGEIVDFNSGGLDLSATIDPTMNEFELDLIINGLAAQSENGRFSLKNIRSRSQGAKVNDYLWLGEGGFSIEQIEFAETKQNAIFNLNDFKSHYNMHKENEASLALLGSFNAADVTANDVNITDIDLNFSLNHLNLDAVTDYVKSIKETYQIQGLSTEQTAAKLQTIATRTGENLIKGSPELIIDNLKFSMGSGFFNSDGKISINGEDLDNIQQLSDPLALNRRLAAKANITFDKRLANAMSTIGIKRQMAGSGMDVSNIPPEQLDQMVNVQTSTVLQTFINQGYITLKDDVYSVQFDMQNGQRLINGKALPIPGM